MPSEFVILLVDDEPHTAEMLNLCAMSVFREANFIHINSVSQANTYLEGLTGHGPRLILLDINFEIGLTGFDFLTYLKNPCQDCTLPVVVLTNSDDKQVIQEAYSLGANAVTRKPYTLEGWLAYTKRLRDYWFDLVTIPELKYKSGK